MEWLTELFKGDDHSLMAAHAVLVISLIAAAGLALGSIRVAGINLGIAGVLFAGLVFGHFGVTIDDNVREFTREFGLILFVYTIGIQVGPGFLASLRRQGLPLNLMAAGIVLLGALIAVLLVTAGRVPIPAAVGLFAGATTNTPSLAAAQQALRDVLDRADPDLRVPGMAYAVAYPFGIIGIILTMLLIRAIFRISPQAENEALTRLSDKARAQLSAVNLQVRNPNLDGVPIRQLPLVGEHGVVISRVLHGNRMEVAQPETVLRLDDIVLAVGPRERLDQLRLLVGSETTTDLRSIPSSITTRRIIVTNSDALGKTIDELALLQRYGVTITRVSRAEIDFTPTPNFRTQFGDTVLAVGEPEAIARAARELGNSPKALNHPQIVPVFVGIALGVILGSWQFTLPAMPAAVKLGLAGGPLLVAIILSRIGKLGPLIWYMPISANLMLREFGIILFLACVGLRSGGQFVETLTRGDGLMWMLYGSLITAVPLMVVALIARAVMKLNYLHLCGLLAGSMTDPPALAFATSISGSDAPSVAYSTVYPLVMLLRVICAQVMVLALWAIYHGG